MSLPLGSTDGHNFGDYNAICDVCGFKFKASELRRRWDGMMVCLLDYEERHPQDLIKIRPDRQAVPWSRPEPTDTFVTPAPIDPDSL
jgi:hypothetical protein